MTTSLRYAWITAQQDRAEHAVSDDEQAASRSATGRFTSVCGQSFFAAPMEAGPHLRCPACARYLCARAGMRTVDERMRPRSWLSRLCHRKPAGRHAPQERPSHQ